MLSSKSASGHTTCYYWHKDDIIASLTIDGVRYPWEIGISVGLKYVQRVAFHPLSKEVTLSDRDVKVFACKRDAAFILKAATDKAWRYAYLDGVKVRITEEIAESIRVFGVNIEPNNLYKISVFYKENGVVRELSNGVASSITPTWIDFPSSPIAHPQEPWKHIVNEAFDINGQRLRILLDARDKLQEMDQEGEKK